MARKKYHNKLEETVAILREHGLTYKEFQIGESLGKYWLNGNILMVKNKEGIYERYGNN